MKRYKNIGMALAVLVLVALVGVLPSSARQKGDMGQNQLSAQAQSPVMSMPEMMQKMHKLMYETSQMKNSMHGNSQTMGHMHGMMMEGDGMMPMCNGMYGMAQSMNGMMTELNGMMSSSQMMRNPEQKEHLLQMQKYMSSMMNEMGTMVGSAKSADEHAEK